ncbi:Predicted anti-sigma-YlaC factor YlaD, contains Zn-finger domain [Actinokineospora alba]|uniref:Predicted anti-sigma-YlaC factor YlaD, contains Zn-finger domain n=1 Tax=Actinokineospora alba TaxID=504798 RepID=A0A1H0W7K5_9PSEU|nr:zf-HC2 domain-containing protein [Actinokineospora alba]TDP70019.1 putative anti-sigma-YlaC factor YlaD [Actinokineospora alba]SDJ49786.1 Predicted anti-sigma-YlaC factor YlaD, contains Zn-finger domain [Actinokineospora alba]SDP86395.1 Predicted anti-sigma-YlaC factor YlaD, contains Zn-finger domain [Actinokineospora alba]
MTCREAVSARLDGEGEPAPAEATDRHLAECAACRQWQAGVVALARSLRVREAVAVPDLTDAILAAAPAATRVWPRVGLGVVAIAQSTLAVAQIVGVDTAMAHVGHGHAGPFAGHLVNESTAWTLALGIGLAWAALRPRAASGLIPVLAGFVVVLLGYSVYDLFAGAVPASRVGGHGVLVFALCLLLLVRRDAAAPTPGKGDAVGTPGEYPDTARFDDRRPAERGPGQGFLRPAGRHRAA